MGIDPECVIRQFLIIDPQVFGQFAKDLQVGFGTRRSIRNFVHVQVVGPASIGLADIFSFKKMGYRQNHIRKPGGGG